MIPYAVIYLLAKRAAGSSQQPAKEGSSRPWRDAARPKVQTTNRSCTSPPTHHAGCALPHQGALGPGAAAAEARQVPVVFGRSGAGTGIGRKRAGEAAAAGFTGTWRARPARFLCRAKKSLRLFLERKMESPLHAYFTQNSPN
jgi:hypothetical protein